MTDDGAVPRSSEAVDDLTPITASRIDVAARIGWLLRTHRSVAGLSLRQMSVALREHGVSLSAASLSRVESEGQRSAGALAGYERAVGLPEGALQVAARCLSRSFPYAVEAPMPDERRSVEAFSRAFEAIDVPAPTGGAWLEFARQNVGGDVGLPRTLMAEQVRRLCLELPRTTRLVARFTRVEALSMLRCSAYADVVDEVARGIVVEPHAQAYWDLTNALAEHPSPELLAWLGSLLGDASEYRAWGASYALQSMLVSGGLGLDDWRGLLVRLDAAWGDAGEDPARRALLAQLSAALPAQLQTELTHRPDPVGSPAPTEWSRSRRNRHYVLAESVARATTQRMGQRDEPLLARLVFESLFDPRGVRMSNAMLLLAFSPFARALVDVLLEQRESLSDCSGWPAGLLLAVTCHDVGVPDPVELMLASPDVAEFRHALAFYRHSDSALPQPAMDRGLSGGEMTVRRVIACLAQTADPRLAAIATDPAVSGTARGAAGWWLEQGPHVLV